jgi:ABC-type polysaccharide/polyol phosphate transport system ATPase subunit
VTAAIELHAVSKRYWQLHEQAMLLKSLIPFARPTKTELWALREMTTSIASGETVGILGRNGAGKTTLLRLLAGVTRPTDGHLVVRGRIAPLISVGVGFHQEMSGRENIYVSGMLLGLSRQQVRERIDEIVTFAELVDFVDTPVKFYSTGMFMRLGFAVAAHVDPDVMLVDEVLAVGDIAFQLKCIERLHELQQRGTTIVLVSHSVHAIRLLCPRALLVRAGRLEFDGDTDLAISRHLELLSVDAAPSPDADASTDERHVGAVSIVKRELLGPNGPTRHPRQDDDVIYRITLRFERAVESPHLSFSILTEEGISAYGMATRIGRDWQTFHAGDVVVADIAFRIRLSGGTYRLAVVVMDRDGRELLCADHDGPLMYIDRRPGSSGIAELEASIVIGDHRLTEQAGRMMVAPQGRLTAEEGPPE